MALRVPVDDDWAPEHLPPVSPQPPYKLGPGNPAYGPRPGYDPRFDRRLYPPWVPPGWLTPRGGRPPPYRLYDPPPGFFRLQPPAGGWGSAIPDTGAALPPGYQHGGFGLHNVRPRLPSGIYPGDVRRV